MDVQKLGAFIAKCPKEKNMTQADLAIKLQVTDKAISRWERGSKKSIYDFSNYSGSRDFYFVS